MGIFPEMEMEMEMEMETGTVTIGKFNELYQKGVIYPYKNNRGGRGIDSSRVNKYAASWDTSSSGCAVIEKTKAGFMLRDFHNRAEAIKRGIAAGKINPKEEILIRVIPPGDGLSAYKNINAARAHSALERLTNPDLFFGKEIRKIIAVSSAFNANNIPPKFYMQLAHIILDLKIKKRSEYIYVKNHAHDINRYKDSPAEAKQDLSLNDNQVKQIARAVDYFGTIRAAAIQACKAGTKTGLTKAAERILNSGQFFGFVIFDYAFLRKLGSADRVGHNIFAHQRKVEELASGLSHGSIEVRAVASKSLNSILCK